MKKVLLSAIALTVAAGPMFAGAAEAAPGRNDRDHSRYEQSQFRNGSYVVNGQRYERARGPAWKAPKGWQKHQWQRGQRMPVEYRRVVVRDYRNYHLAPPPRGYQYVRDGNDVVLTAIATGIIGAVIANAFIN